MTEPTMYAKAKMEPKSGKPCDCVHCRIFAVLPEQTSEDDLIRMINTLLCSYPVDDEQLGRIMHRTAVSHANYITDVAIAKEARAAQEQFLARVESELAKRNGQVN